MAVKIVFFSFVRTYLLTCCALVTQTVTHGQLDYDKWVTDMANLANITFLTRKGGKELIIVVMMMMVVVVGGDG